MTKPAEETTGGRRLPPLVWGVLGAARIARKLVPAFREAGGIVSAVGASTLDKAQAFAAELEIPRALDGYQAVIDDPEITAIYLPLSNDLHFRWALACARAGKSCLCEKPMVLTSDEARQLREAFALAGTRLAEGFMWRHNPQTQWALKQIHGGEIGELVRVHAEFSFNLDRPGDFRWRDESGGGSMWDVGVYCINAMRLLMGEEPRAVSARIEAAPGTRGADRSAAAWLDFGGGRLGTMQSSFVTAWSQRVLLTGTRGTMEISNPFIGKIDKPTRVIVANENGAREQTFAPSNSFVAMAQHFRRAVYDPSFALMPAEDGCAQAAAMEALAASAIEGGTVRVLGEME